MSNFSKIHQKAINEKTNQIKKVCDGLCTYAELADIITERRVSWLKANLNKMLKKYKDLPPEEQAWHIIYFDHMKIEPKHSKMTRISSKKIRIDSYNFCPYLEAVKKLKLDTKIICKKVGEPSIQKMCEMIHPKLKFSRNYNNIRPKNKKYCEEYIEIKK